MIKSLTLTTGERIRLINIIRSDMDSLNKFLDEELNQRIENYLKTELRAVEELYNKIVLISPTEEKEVKYE